jgi:hypothetical protein
VVDWWGGRVFIDKCCIAFGILDEPAPTLILAIAPLLILFIVIGKISTPLIPQKNHHQDFMKTMYIL